jgi:hypothetical protein
VKKIYGAEKYRNNKLFWDFRICSSFIIMNKDVYESNELNLDLEKKGQLKQ